MTQPGVSQHIKKLELQLGKALLHRHGKQFELTDAGEHLLQYGKQLFQQEQALMDYLTDSAQLTGECRLACSGSLAMQLYPKLLELQPNYPGLTFSVEAAPNRGIIQRLKENKCELGLVTQKISEPELQQEELGEDELCLVLPADQSVSWQALVALGFINHPDGHHYGNTLMARNFPDEFSGLQQFPQSSFVNQLSQILLPVAMGLGFTVVPRSCIKAFHQPERLQIAALNQPVTETLYLTQKKHRPLGRRYTLVKEVLYQLFKS